MDNKSFELWITNHSSGSPGRPLIATFGVREMKFHDFHLKGYSVLESGRRIVLDLMYDYPNQEMEKSRIEFSGVVCYHFSHTTGAIITDIEEVRVEELVKEEAALLESFAHAHGLTHWEKNLEQYANSLVKAQMRAWRIGSAIGFSGFVIGAGVESTP